MSRNAITIEGLSKAYRIGEREQSADTLVAAAVQWLRRPLENLRRLTDLSTFGESGSADNLIWAVRDLSLSVREGEVLGIIGPNGAGKSTLLKILSRITHPTRGRVEIRGRVSSLLEVGTGFHPELTGRENIYMNGIMLGMKKREVDAKLDEIVAFSGFERFLDTPVKRYSSGMQVRLAFSVAAHLDPEVLIVDEVLAVGDAEFQRKCIGRMQNVAMGGRTVLFVSHNMTAVRSLCTRAIWLEQGRLVAHDDVETVIGGYLSHQSAAAGNSSEYRPDPEIGRHRQVRIARLATVGDDGRVVQVVKSRADLRFELELESRLDTNCTVAIAVRDLSNNLLTNSISDDFGETIRVKPGTNRFLVTLRNTQFKEGQYFVNASVGNKLGDEPYDAVSRALTFDVQGDGHGQFRTAALFLTDTEWEEL
jgi:lipopolysaccharide transport system ATP-binding protein